MGDALIMIAVLAIGVWFGYNVAQAPGEGFRERLRNFFGLSRLDSR